MQFSSAPACQRLKRSYGEQGTRSLYSLKQSSFKNCIYLRGLINFKK